MCIYGLFIKNRLYKPAVMIAEFYEYNQLCICDCIEIDI